VGKPYQGYDMKTIYAFTGPTPAGMSYPAFLNVSADDSNQSKVVFTVRGLDQSYGHQVTLTLQEAGELAGKLMEHIKSCYPAPAVIFMINQELYHALDGELITYEMICHQSKQNPDHNPSCVFAFKYGRSGSLSKGEAVAAESGLVINCLVTGNA
jgi:hypothetical protein